MRLRRARFADVISRQLDLFERENAQLLRECDEALGAYSRAGRDGPEESYARYDELIELATDALEELRDGYASTLAEPRGEEYEREFERAVARRFPALAPGLG